jgi:hydroxymethylglutaryl-CoA reductase
MIEHLSLIVRVSNGKMRVKQVTPPEKIERLQAFLRSDQPLPREFKAPFIQDLPPLANSSIAEAIKELQEEIRHFEAHFGSDGVKEMHPVFGELDHESWIRFHHKHFTHHLSQFGLIKEEGN